MVGDVQDRGGVWWGMFRTEVVCGGGYSGQRWCMVGDVQDRGGVWWGCSGQRWCVVGDVQDRGGVW